MLVLKLSLRPWRLAPYSQVFSGIAVGFLLLLSGFLIWLQQGLDPVVARLMHEQVITAYLDPAVEQKDEPVVMDSIRTSLGAHAERAEIKMVRRDEFVGNLRKQYPELAREIEDLGQENSAVIPRYVSIAGLFPDSALDHVRTVQGIESAETSKDRYRHIVGAFSALRWVARLLIVGLGLALLTGLIHLARVNSYLHKDVISLMRLWGAGSWSLHLPGVMSGLYVGVLGGAMALAGWVTGASWLIRQVRQLSPMLRDLPLAAPEFALILLAVGSVIGLFAGVFATISVTRAGSSQESAAAAGGRA